MTVRLLSASLLFALVPALPGAAFGQDGNRAATTQSEGKAATSASQAKGKAAPTDVKPANAKPNKPEVATFGGGCFWCTEAVCEQVPGVLSVVSGYSGGNVPFPTYEAVSSEATGHAEVVQVVFNPSIISYEKLLEVFFRSHDPTTPNAQGPDVGTQYRSIVLYHNDEQRKAAQQVYRDLKARRILKGTVVTELLPFVAFFPAEAYHQDYYRNHPFDPYSMVYIEPKFDVFWKMKMVNVPKARKRSSTRGAKAAVSPGTGQPSASKAKGSNPSRPAVSQQASSEPGDRARPGSGVAPKDR